jgi:hypothetical protein
MSKGKKEASREVISSPESSSKASRGARQEAQRPGTIAGG